MNSWTFETTCVVMVSVAVLTSGCATFHHHKPSKPGSTLAGGGSTAGQPGAAAQPQEQPAIEPDRPDVTNGTHTVPKDLIQLETGGQYARVPVAGEIAATPASFRMGLADWFEGDVETEGVTREKQAGQPSNGFGGLTLGGKFRLWAAPGGMPVLAIMPQVTLPWGRGEDSGTDFFVRILTGRDWLEQMHVNVNYAAGAIATGHSHFVQHMVSIDNSARIGKNWNPYAEVYWFSRLDLEGHRVFSLDTGVVYTLSERLAVDGGIAFGLSAAAGHPAFFGGLSVIVGAITGREGVHQRLREAQLRGNF